MMNMRSSPKLNYKLFLGFVLVILLSGCQPTVSYKPPLLPVKLVIDGSGKISIEGEGASLVTPIGTFSIGFEYLLNPEEDSILVVVRDRRTGSNQIFRIDSGYDDFVAVLNGLTTVHITNRQVTIDVSDGNIQSIEFKKIANSNKEKEGFYLQPYALGYQPFGLAKWAYGDSDNTIDDVVLSICPIGFIVFLFRLLIAILLLPLDIVLIIVLGIGAVLESFFSVTVRNVYFGLLALLAILLILRFMFKRLRLREWF